MYEEKRVVMLDEYERRLMVNGLTDFRNDLLRGNKPTEDVDNLIVKIIDAPTASSRAAYRLFPPLGEKRARSAAPPFPAESADSAEAPRKRKANREAR